MIPNHFHSGLVTGAVSLPKAFRDALELFTVVGAAAPMVYVIERTPLPPALSLAERATVTLPLFQPAPFGPGEAVATVLGATVSAATTNVAR